MCERTCAISARPLLSNSCPSSFLHLHLPAPPSWPMTGVNRSSHLGAMPRNRRAKTNTSLMLLVLFAVCFGAAFRASAQSTPATTEQNCSLQTFPSPFDISAVEELFSRQQLGENLSLSVNESVVSVVENCRRRNSDGLAVEVTFTVTTSEQRTLQVNAACSSEQPASNGSADDVILQQYGYPSSLAYTGNCARCSNSTEPCQGRKPSQQYFLFLGSIFRNV